MHRIRHKPRVTDLDEKTCRILAAARDVFARHGYRKTSMQDVADAAGISRAALYLRFRNKEDLFRSGAAAVHAEVLERTREALAADAPIGERLRRAMLAFTEGFLAPLDQAGHGQELFAASADLAAQIDADSRADLRRLLHDALERAVAGKEITLPPDCDAGRLADLVHTTATGFKHAGDGLPALRRRIDLFTSVLATALASRASNRKST